MIDKNQIEKIVESMSLDELCGQILNFDLTSPEFEVSEFDEICAQIHPGSVYIDVNGSVFNDSPSAKITRDLIATANKNTRVPVAVTSDGGIPEINDYLTQMAWGATDDTELMEEFAKVYGQNMRRDGIHVLLGPVVDINYNKDNPVTNVRAFSDDPDHVIKMGSAYVKGLISDNQLIACCKHFPGDGMDDRNQHFCTTVNSKSKQEWLDTYGRVYKEMFKSGAKSVMCAHICLPSWQPEEECMPLTGYLPCSLSHALMTDLLKGELGFDGCIISDAMNMIGAVTACEREKLGVKYIQAGGDLMLFAHPEDFYYIRQAVLNGEISMERLKDAVTRVLIMKNSVNLLNDEANDTEVKITGDIDELLQKAAAEAIKIERNANNVLPLKLEKNAHILMINLFAERLDVRIKDMYDPLKQELLKRGYKVSEMSTPFCHRDLEDVCEKYDCVLVSVKYDPTYSNGGTFRLGSDHMGPFWDGFGLRHPKMVYLSFGDPYKLYEHPFLHTYVNCFSGGMYSQQACAKVLFGEAQAVGKNPVQLKGFFDRDV